MRKILVAAAVLSLGAVSLAGCSLFSETTAWTKPGVTPEEAQDDLDTCKQVAWASREADEKIDQDTSSSMGDSAGGAVDTELSQNMSSQRSGKRTSDIINACMRELGYMPAN